MLHQRVRSSDQTGLNKLEQLATANTHGGLKLAESIAGKTTRAKQLWDPTEIAIDKTEYGSKPPAMIVARF